MLQAYCKAKSLVLSDLTKPKYYAKLCKKKYGFRRTGIAVTCGVWDKWRTQGGTDLSIALLRNIRRITRKRITDETILEKVSEASKHKVHIAKSKSGIVVKESMILSPFSRCCNPVPGMKSWDCDKRKRNVDSSHRLCQYSSLV